MFLKLPEAKVKGGIFIGLQVKVMLNTENPERKMSEVGREALCELRRVIQDFLGNHKVPEYKKVVAKLIESYKNVGCRMLLKLHFSRFSHSHFGFFRDNL